MPTVITPGMAQTNIRTLPLTISKGAGLRVY